MISILFLMAVTAFADNINLIMSVVHYCERDSFDISSNRRKGIVPAMCEVEIVVFINGLVQKFASGCSVLATRIEL